MLWLVYITSFMMIGFALMLVATNQPVRSVLCLIGCFLCATIHWILLDAEFLALALIFVYIGAVMTLFLFMVMMLNVDSYAPEYRLGLATFFVLITFSLLLPSFGFYLWDAHLSSSAAVSLNLRSATATLAADRSRCVSTRTTASAGGA